MQWTNVNDQLPDTHSDIFQVRLQDNSETTAYFYQDSIAWIAYYGLKTSHWWRTTGMRERLDNVTHWRPKK